MTAAYLDHCYQKIIEVKLNFKTISNMLIKSLFVYLVNEVDTAFFFSMECITYLPGLLFSNRA